MMAVCVVGAGIMGAGIAQVAAQAGHTVYLVDTRAGAAQSAIAQIGQQLHALAQKGKISAEAANAAHDRLRVADTLEAAVTAAAETDREQGIGLVVEAIAEQLEAKRALFQQLECVVPPDCILASNTSSISITAIANGLRNPERLVGMHFFNPVPLMQLVEVVSGLQTDVSVAQATFDLATAWGKVAVHARSTPGFIVNRIARPYYAEALALLQEQAATPEAIDACLRGAGFRMGPCELMDLIGHDTNFAVTQSVYAANFYDKRFQPSLVQHALVDGGLLGRKSGRGFYRYPSPATPALPSVPKTPDTPTPPASGTAPGPGWQQALTVHGHGAVAEALFKRLQAANTGAQPLPVLRQAESDWTGLSSIGNHGHAGHDAQSRQTFQLRLTDGRCATALGRNVAVFDLPLATLPTHGAGSPTAPTSPPPLAWAPSAVISADWLDAVPRLLQVLGFNPIAMADTPGLVVARSVAMLINEAADAVHQGVCSRDAADAAMRRGVNYPAGPLEWLDGWGAAPVCALLDALDRHYRGERYRTSPWLLMQVWKASA